MAERPTPRPLPSRRFPACVCLRQPLEETLLLLSLQAPPNRSCRLNRWSKLLAQRHGREIAPESPSPTWRNSRRVSEEALRSCCSAFAPLRQPDRTNPGRERDWFNRLEQLPYHEAKERLRELPGVGEKVADCVLLFGAGRLEAFR